jgi:hypothetical protein
MAKLSKKRGRGIVSSGHEYVKLSDTVFGFRKSRISKESELFSNDYIYMYSEDDDEDSAGFLEDKEIGINKNYCYFHEESDSDGYKNVSARQERREMLEFEDYIRMVKIKGGASDG